MCAFLVSSGFCLTVTSWSHEKQAEFYLNRVYKRMGSLDVKKKVYNRIMADKAVARAEVEIEELMRAKAIDAFCISNCPKGCSFGAVGNIGCGAKE